MSASQDLFLFCKGLQSMDGFFWFTVDAKTESFCSMDEVVVTIKSDVVFVWVDVASMFLAKVCKHIKEEMDIFKWNCG